MTYTGLRYDKDGWRASVTNGEIARVRLREVEAWPTWDADLRGPALAHPEAAASMGALLRQAQEDGRGDLAIAYSYRALETQQRKWDLWMAGTGNLAARPGTSNHGWAVSFDMRWGRGTTLSWLQANARRYGFVADVPGENWHYTLQEGLWRGDDLTRDEKRLLTWLDGFRDAVTGNLGGQDTGPSIGKRLAEAIEHSKASHSGGVDLSGLASMSHRHPEGRTGLPIKTDEGHIHPERMTGVAVSENP